MVKNRIEKVKLLGLATSHRLAAVLGDELAAAVEDLSKF
jgi:hypothetical protein